MNQFITTDLVSNTALAMFALAAAVAPTDQDPAVLALQASCWSSGA